MAFVRHKRSGPPCRFPEPAVAESCLRLRVTIRVGSGLRVRDHQNSRFPGAAGGRLVVSQRSHNMTDVARPKVIHALSRQAVRIFRAGGGTAQFGLDESPSPGRKQISWL